MAGNVESDTFSLMAICKEFGGNTSMHGIGRALNNRNPCSRFLWSVITVLGLGASVYQFVLTVTDFYSYPVTTVVTVKQETKVPFPGVTICNLNRKRKSKVDPQLLADLLNITEPDASPDDSTINSLMRDTMLGEEDPGHQLEDMLIKCVFNRNMCFHDNFEEMYTATYGTCYTFKANQLFNYSTRSGPQSGLILELNIEQYEYLPLTSKAGVKVIVHPHDETPFPEDGGILAQPGAATSIGVRRELTRRLPSPYSSCISAYGESSSQNNLFTKRKYTQGACIKFCYQRNLIRFCKCSNTDIFYGCADISKTDWASSEENCIDAYCSSKKNLACQVVVEGFVMNGEMDCDEACPPACDSTTFDTVVSTALWPSDAYFDVFIEKVNYLALEKMNLTSKSAIQQFVRSNFLRIEIFLESLEVTEIVTQPKYDWNMLLGNIGGQLGLWLGFSLLTALEITELLIDAVWFFIRKVYKKKTTTPTEDN